VSDGQTLFLTLCLLYLSDCLVWIGTRTVLFSAPRCRRWRPSFGSPYAGNAAGSLALLNPLPPLGTAFLAHWSPVSLSARGICDLCLQVVGDRGRPAQTGRVILYEEIRASATDGKHLLINGSRFAKCATGEQAQTLSRLVERVSRETAANREKVIRECIDAQFDKEAASQRLTQVRGLIPSLRWMCASFFVFLYVVVPILAHIYGLARLVLPTAGIMLLAAVAIARRFLAAHRVLYPARKGDRVSNVVKMILCPLVALRAIDLVTLDALSRFHPVGVAGLLPGPESTAFARAVVRDLRHPLQFDVTDPDGIAIARWYATVQLEACVRFLTAEDSRTIDRVLAPPSWDGLSATYCPRCSSQYTIPAGECPDCPGVPLLPWPQA
jgi:hypothetical protein